jgi:hypothetical protein
MDETVAPLEGLVGRDQTDEPADDDRASTTEPDAWRVELSEEIVLQSAGGGEFQVPNAAEELGGRSGAAPVEPPERGRPEAEPPALAELPEAEPPATELARAEEAQPEAPADVSVVEPPDTPPAADKERGLVVTESMAELLVQQGHLTEALRVYRELEVRLGSDPRIRQRIGDLEGAPPPPAVTRQAYAIKDTHGQSVAEFFRGMLAARPPAPSAPPAKRVDATVVSGPAAEPEGAPTRPAHDSLSLSSVFGDEGTPTPPAVPVSVAASPPAPADGAVSFDQFYSQPDRGDTPRPARAPDGKSDDLDQFHAWLQNLKR